MCPCTADRAAPCSVGCAVWGNRDTATREEPLRRADGHSCGSAPLDPPQRRLERRSCGGTCHTPRADTHVRTHKHTQARTRAHKHARTQDLQGQTSLFVRKTIWGKKKKATYGSRPSAGTRLKHRWLPVFFLHLLLLCSDYQATPITCCRHFYSLFIFQSPPQATPPPKPEDDREKKINTRSSIFQTDFITNVAPQKKKFLFKFLFISYFQASPWRSFPQACVYV